MELKMYAIRDAKGETFGNPFFKHMHGEAERDFTAACRDPKTSIHQFPEDFDLYHLGVYDTVKGTVTSLDTPQHMMKAISVKQQ